MTANVANETMSAANQIIDHTTTPAFSFSFNDFLKREYRFGLDTSRPVCRAFLQGHCPAGKLCPDRHTANTSFSSLVCKHWHRGLCKKGDACEFLHEFNLRKMPECGPFSRTRYCANGDECLYQHLDPDSPYRLPPCPHYDKGFCPLGPRCAKKHARKTLCPYYLAGFCTDGKQCRQGAHPKWPTTELPPPTVRVKKDPAELERELALIREEMERNEEREREKGGFGGRRDWGGNVAAGGGNLGGGGGGRGRGRGQRGGRRGAY
ncbi:MAG: RNA-binding component of cleavage and polyadenylation factor [Peltula sp. TS41687]|nr:MAG: RNA-binding component of cleavage and polyadenylation factor [Peltula sp. TS41687]